MRGIMYVEQKTNVVSVGLYCFKVSYKSELRQGEFLKAS